MTIELLPLIFLGCAHNDGAGVRVFLFNPLTAEATHYLEGPSLRNAHDTILFDPFRSSIINILMIPRKFLIEWVEEQRRAFLAVVGLSEYPVVAQIASAGNQEPISEEPARPHPLHKPPSILPKEKTHPRD